MNYKTKILIFLFLVAAVLASIYFKKNIKEPPMEQPEKIYTVSEILKIRDTNPDSLKNKSILLNAYAIDGVAGINCEDFSILSDYENVDFYQDYIKRYSEGKTTAEEKIKFDNIPRLEASIRTDKIQRNISEYIIIGHFYDEWNVDNCKNGWMRFAITGEKETPKEAIGEN